MIRPNFLGIGVAKAGTTSLFHYLNAHPHIKMAKAKEVHYFDINFSNGPGWYGKQFPKYDPKFYKFGEISPSYIFYPGALERIRDFDPNTKLILLLRNPVQRALSHFWMEKKRNKESLTPIQAMKQEEQRVPKVPPRIYRYNYKARGLYKQQLDKLFSLFDPKQVFIAQIEHFNQAKYDKLCEFLGVEHQKLPLTKHFQGNYGQADKETLKFLQDFYLKPNQELFETYKIDYR
jgi:hypothetical protein